MEWRLPFPYRLKSIGMISFFVGARTLPIHYWDCIFILLQYNKSVWAKQLKYLFIKGKVWNLLILHSLHHLLGVMVKYC